MLFRSLEYTEKKRDRRAILHYLSEIELLNKLYKNKCKIEINEDVIDNIRLEHKNSLSFLKRDSVLKNTLDIIYYGCVDSGVIYKDVLIGKL